MTKNMDVAARSLDLATVISRGSSFDIIAAITTASAEGANDLVRWLARERIGHDSFVFAMQLGQDVADPNPEGRKVLARLATTASRLYGLQLILPGALGRSVISDAKFRWIATTEAVLLKFHSSDFAVAVLCEVFIRSFRGIDVHDRERAILDVRIRPVLEKLVDSIHLHTVNMGHGVEELPSELQNIPEHNLAAIVFANIICYLRKTNSEESGIVISMDYGAAGLITWIFLHWHGRLIISLANEIVFERQLGNSLNSATIIIKKRCKDGKDCRDPTHIKGRPIDIGRVVQGEFVSDYMQKNPRPFQDEESCGHRKSTYRSPLYEFVNPNETKNLALNPLEKKQSQRAAQSVVRSIMSLKVQPSDHDIVSLSLFTVKGSKNSFQAFAKKMPTLLQLNLSNVVTNESLLGDWALAEMQERASTKAWSPLKTEAKARGKIPDFSDGEIIQQLVSVRASMALAQERCTCGCDSQILSESTPNETYLYTDRGCVMDLMFAEIMLLIGHALAEAAGAIDVSNLRSQDSALGLIDTVRDVLGYIIRYGEIPWNTWFRLAATAITGQPHHRDQSESFSSRSDGILLSFAGDITVAPIWLSMDEEIGTKGTWGVQRLTGCVAGADAEYGLIEAELTSDVDLFPQELTEPKEAEPSIITDVGDVAITTAIFARKNNMFRLMTLVQASDSMRVLSAFDVYRGILQAKRPVCEHDQTDEKVSVRPSTFRDVLLLWSINYGLLLQQDKAVATVLCIHEERMRRNIAIGFSNRRTVLGGKTCCFRCFVQAVQSNEGLGIWCTSNNESLVLGKR